MTTNQGRPRVHWLIAAALSLLLVSAAPAASAFGASDRADGGEASRRARDPALVLTDTGPVRGTVSPDHRAFLGIPYAAPPIGTLRWQSPQPVAAWSTPRDATQPGAICPQAARPPLFPIASNTEDCLFLNVYTPLPAGWPTARLPVMVWLHGGSFTNGAGSQYDPTRMAVLGQVIVVTVNYRLGALGWLAHPALDGPRPSGNWGLEDQQAALRWVQLNALRFGGDPDRATLFGESAGAASVCAHLASPAAARLFARAITQSGPCVIPFPTQPVAALAGGGFALSLGCTDLTDADCLRSKSVDELLGAQAKGGLWFPVVDGAALPQQPKEALLTGAAGFEKVPLISGSTHDEMRLFVGLQFDALGHPVTAAQYLAIVTVLFGPQAGLVLARYPLSHFPTPSLALATIETDSGRPLLGACPALATDRLAALHVPTFAYEFADEKAPFVPPLPEIAGFPWGAAHGSELAYLPSFAALPSDPAIKFTTAQQQLADTMIRYWTQFARTGDPNGDHTPRWPRFRDAQDVLSLAPGSGGIHPVDFAQEHHCRFWDSLLVS